MADPLWTFTLLAMSIVIYFLPAIAANGRRHRKRDAIVILNILAGWTVVGWIVAMVWAFTEDNRPPL